MDRSELAWNLGTAIISMAGRYGSTMQRFAYSDKEGRADTEKLFRATSRQFRSIRRLTEALERVVSG